MELFISEWLALIFYPIEDAELLAKLRVKLSPFMRAVQDCSKLCLYRPSHWDPRESYEMIVDSVINTASSDVDPELLAQLTLLMETLDHDELNREHKLLENMNISSFQHHDMFKRTVHLVQSYIRENSLISADMRDQGSSSYTCWAYSCATMIRTSCHILLRHLYNTGEIDKVSLDLAILQLQKDRVHVELRNLIMMLLVPKKLHTDGEHQGAFLRAAVSRVS